MHRPRLLQAAIIAALAGPAAIAGCATHQTYNPYYRDYGRWDGDDRWYYQRWEVVTRRDHRDFDRRTADEQRAYWHWRQRHDRDRDRDRDQDRDRH
jgi:hypothetical protein